jgi:hypothetical protein
VSGVRRGEQGFVLIAAIWFIALLSLVAVVIAGWMTRSLGLADRLQHRLAAHAALIGAQNEIAFRVVSGFFSARGLELPSGKERERAAAPASSFGYSFAAATPYLALDGRPYRFDSTIVRLQDNRGLLNLGHPNQLLLGSLLQHYGVPYQQRGVLLSRLLDYISLDASGLLHRLNGATIENYRQAGRPPPRGAPLLTPWEAARVLSWDDYPELWRGPADFAALTATTNFVQLNPNTAPEPILAALPGMTPEAVQRVMNFRQKKMIQSKAELDLAAGTIVGIEPMSLMFVPAPSIDVTLAAEKDPLVYRMQFSLTPIGDAPYRLGYLVALPTAEAATRPGGEERRAEAPLSEVPPVHP